jgi:hypothetical protein
MKIGEPGLGEQSTVKENWRRKTRDEWAKGNGWMGRMRI